MQRWSVLGLVVVLIVAVAAWFATRSAGAPPPAAPVPAAMPADAAAAAAHQEEPPNEAAASGSRSEVHRATGAALDPEVRAALTGFKGRVVDHKSQVVADCGVRIYRGALDSIVPESVDPFADAPAYAPHYVAGETKTLGDGTFLIDGVWPRGFYLLFAGIGTDAPSHRLLAQAPAPGEIVDLGDIVLNDAAVVTGTVVDEDGNPVAGALVRGVDLPGQVLAFFPIERIDPEGCLLIREKDSPVHVFEFPAWAKEVFAQLPVPATHSDSQGEFRLAGLVPGSNVIATTHQGYLSDVKPGVPLKAGQVKALGRITLKHGEDLAGRVVDTKGAPVAGAEVVAGSTSAMAPVDPGQRVGTTDADGRFTARGFGAGKVTAAARRSARDPWVLAEPQSILNDVVVTVPAAFALTVRVTDPVGEIVKAPKLKVVAGNTHGPGSVMAVLGFMPAIDLRGRTAALEDGRVRIADLPEGDYIVLAVSETAAMGTGEVSLCRADAEVQIQLPARVEYRVRVLGPGDAPIRSASIYVREHDHGRELPFLAGRTDGDGRLLITQTSSKELTVSADHPRWGCVNGRVSLGDGELVLHMEPPGWIEGTLQDHGKAPLPGKYTIAAEYRPDVRGPLEAVPILATPGLQGAFALKALQPGRYHVGVISSLDAVTSPGAVMGLAQSMFMTGDLPDQDVQVASGQGARVELNVGASTYAGPTAHLFGSLQVDGRLGGDFLVMLWVEGGRRMAKVDAAGQFDFGQVPATSVQVNVVEGGESGMLSRRGLWDMHVELKPGEERQLVIDFATTAITGTVVRPDGSPGAGMYVQARGRRLDQKPEDGNESWNGERTDQEGSFAFERLPTGVYRFEVNTRGTESLRGALADVRADGSGPVTGLRIVLQPAIVVAGRVDTSSFAGKPSYLGMSFWSVDPARPEQKLRQVAWSGAQESDGSFSTEELGPGTYAVQLYVQVGEDWQEYDATERIVVPPQGVSGLLVRPAPRPPNGARR